MSKKCEHHWHDEFDYKHTDPLPCGARQWSYRTKSVCCKCQKLQRSNWSYWYDDNINDKNRPQEMAVLGVDR